MTIKITSFSFSGYEGEGTGYAVSMTFRSDSQAEALAALKLLSGDPVAGWDLSGQGSAKDDAPPTKIAPKTTKAVVVKAVETPPAKAPKAPPQQVEAFVDEEEDDEEEEAEEEEAEEEAPAPAPAGQKTVLKITGDDLKALKDTKKLRDVLQYLITVKGLKTKKALSAACAAIKDKVPALARIEDLEDRIPGAIELMDPSIK